MDDRDRLKAWSSYAEISRKWVSVMDAKAGFIAALNLGLLALLWSGAKIQDGNCFTKVVGIAATIFIAASIISAVWVALPRESLKDIFGKGIRWHEDYRPVSFYGFVAKEYGKKDFERFKADTARLTDAQLAEEALEQHFVISHTAARKSGFVKVSGLLLMSAASLSVVAVITRVYA